MDEIDYKILQLIGQGHHYRAMANAVGMSLGGVHARVQRLTERELVMIGKCPVCGHDSVPLLTENGVENAYGGGSV